MDELWEIISNNEPDKLNAEWLGINVIKGALDIGFKAQENSPSYSQIIKVAKILAPELYNNSLIEKSQEPRIVQEYREIADARSQSEGRRVEPIDEIDNDIEDTESLLLAKRTHDKKRLRQKLTRLQNARVYFAPNEYSENRALMHDYSQVNRNLPRPPIELDKYISYTLSNNRALNIRFLHPEVPEHITGADLIYEFCSDVDKTVRIAVIQYKIWDGKTLLFSKAPNLAKQLGKLEKSFCDIGVCNIANSVKPQKEFRLPFCAAFLRPTNKLQNFNSALISKGVHVPICAVKRLTNNTDQGGKKLESYEIQGEAMSQKIFEETFSINMLGSRWLSYEELEEIYKKSKILEPNENIVMHAQEYESLDDSESTTLQLW